MPRELRERLEVELRRAGSRELGGVLMAEHVGMNEFALRDLTIHRRGSFASFVRRIEEALDRLKSFFKANSNNYRRFNYIGEWHSHPSFVTEPSPHDDASMREIALDPDVGANFVVLLVVKLEDSSRFAASLHTYLPDGSKHRSTLEMI